MTEAAKAHPISIARNPNRVRVHFNGRVVADSRSALTLKDREHVRSIPDFKSGRCWWKKRSLHHR